jgi:predicted DNA binding CopG/RHH family protein
MNSKIESTSDAWETGQLGQDEKFVEKANLGESDFNEALELQMISIRLQKSLINDLKAFAKIHEVGYQPLMKMILKRWVDGEFKTLGNQYMQQQLQEKKDQEALQTKKQTLKTG